ncbi:hypothetical protein MBLNU230_g3508t1 [Neophaeotheca triangularis]
MITRIHMALLAALALLALIVPAFAQTATETVNSPNPSTTDVEVEVEEGDDTRWITYTASDGELLYLDDARTPSLYTDEFGDCLGGSAINVTRFDAAYYKDNMTVLFHLEGTSALTNESLMMYIGVFAYGEARFDLNFDPCSANIASLCPVNDSIPISANGIIPVAESDVAAIPEIALSIPDFEGQAILRIFSNATESEIGCYTAVVTNGASFSHPAAVGTVLGVFTLITLLASFATAVYGQAIPTMRLHHAHSLSVGVVFAVWQHIFFTGALSLNWPSVLPAFWSNFAWAGGMIYSSSMQDSINSFIGNNAGNTSSVGAAESGTSQSGLGGGYDISQIYKRGVMGGAKAMLDHPLVRDVATEIYQFGSSGSRHSDLQSRAVEQMLERRDEGGLPQYGWYGQPVTEGLPLPGNYSGFAGTLAPQKIRASNAFMTSFLWLLIILVILVAATMAFKWILEGLSAVKALRKDRLAYFRSHWLGYSALVALRTCFIAFFAMILLTTFQFTYAASAGVTAVAAIVFIIFLVGLPGACVYACFYKIRLGNMESNPERFQTERKKLLGVIPWFGTKRVPPACHNEQGQGEQEPEDKTKMPFWKRSNSAQPGLDGEQDVRSIHDDEAYTKRFGWLAARFRRTKWWFFAFWVPYEFVRGVFYGAGAGQALAQVFGLLVVEVLAFAFMIWARPFESTRLNVLVVYCLGFSKVATVGLSAAFDIQWNLERITTTVIGIVIIVIQGILTIITLIAIIVAAISSAMSISRNRETFRPKKWNGMREKYFDHLDRAVTDLPRAPKQKKVKQEPVPIAEEKHGFEVKGVRREPRIEDEDADFNAEMASTANPSKLSLDGAAGAAATPGSRRLSRAASTHSTSNLPYGARSHRPSWSSRDFVPGQPDRDGADADGFTPVAMSQQVAEDDDYAVAGSATPKRRHSRMRSRSNTQNSRTINPQISSESLGVGADVSSRDSIGKVPQPGMRPRAGSGPRSRGNSMNQDDAPPMPDAAWLTGSSRGGRAPPLTPAQEVEEWGVMGPR